MGTEASKTDDDHEGNKTPGAGDRRLRWYPRAWRARYGDELTTLLDDEYGIHLPIRVRLSLLAGGLQQRARQSGLTGDSAPAADGVRAGALVVLTAWTAFVIAGASFAKFSEHFDEALPHGNGVHRLPDLAFAVLQDVACVAGVLVVTGALLAVPAFLRFLRGGGWTSVRNHILRALACSALTLAVTAPLLQWAHHLTAHQRNGGIHWYGAVFLIWAGLIVVTLSMWTVAAVAAGRQLELSRHILNAEAALGVLVAVAMVAMVGATAVWWAAMVKNAPSYLNASPGGAPGSPWDVWLIATVALMVGAMGTAAAGAFRIARVRIKMPAD
jgi:hypothetical protein